MNDFRDAARQAGFTDQQIDFLDEFLAKRPHTHEIAEVEDLQDTLDGIYEGLDELGEAEVGEDEEEE